MRKVCLRLFLLLLMSLSPYMVAAQFSNSTYNTNFSFSLFPSVYVGSTGVSIGGGTSLSYGKWILTTAGVRARFAFNTTAIKNQTRNYQYFNADLFVNPLPFFKLSGKNDLLRSYFIVGVGLVRCNTRDRDFCGSLGVGLDFKINKDWRLFAEVHSYIHPSDFDDNSRSSFLSELSLGATYDIDYNPTRSRNRYESQGFSNDWFFNLMFGVNSFNYRGIKDLKERFELLTPIFEFGIGKRLNTTWAVRLSASGLYARSSEELFSYYNVRGDIILDVVGWLMPDKGTTMFDFKPYLSASIISRLDDQKHFLFSTVAGSIISYRPNKKNELFIDVNYLLSPPRFAHVSSNQSTFTVGMATVMLGYGYFFSKKNMN